MYQTKCSINLSSSNMLIPSSVNPNTLKVYQINETLLKSYNNKLQSANLHQWDDLIPNSLQELCLISIAKNWKEKPILKEIIQPIDRFLLLDIISVDLPLKLTVPIIDEDVYWKRCYLFKWPNKIPFDVRQVEESSEIVRISTSRKSSINDSNISRRSSQVDTRKSSLETAHLISWKESFLEMYIKEYLERLHPDSYEAETIKELSDLCGQYIKILNIEELQCSQNTGNRIPLNPILMAFQNLKELSLCFRQKHVGDNFSWNVVRTNVNEIKLLARGLEHCRLIKFRILNSDINCNKLELLLMALSKHIGLKILDFSHCKIADRGALELAKFFIENPIKTLILTNNKIGFHGVQSLCYGLFQQNCKLRFLSIRLNQITDDGANFIMQTLAVSNTNLKTLIMGACGFTKIPKLNEMIKANKNLETLDISNNRIGEETGKSIIDALNYNKNLKCLDLRMCRISSAAELQIKEKLKLNMKSKCQIPEYYVEDGFKKDFLDQIENVSKYFHTIV